MNILLRLIKINANYYSFISGMFAAISINLYTGIFTSEQIPTRWKVVLLSSILTFVSSVCWAYLSWKFDPIQKLALSESPSEIHPEQTYRVLLAGKESLLVAYFLSAILSASLGLAILPIGY